MFNMGKYDHEWQDTDYVLDRFGKTIVADLAALNEKAAVYFKVDIEELKAASRERSISHARSVVCYLAVRKLMISCADVARALKISPSTVSKTVIKGRVVYDRRKIQKALLGN